MVSGIAALSDVLPLVSCSRSFFETWFVVFLAFVVFCSYQIPNSFALVSPRLLRLVVYVSATFGIVSRDS